VLALIPDESLRNGIGTEISGQNTSVDRWNLINKRVHEFLSDAKKPKTSANILNEIMLQVRLV
jgi:hypothetical protein